MENKELSVILQTLEKLKSYRAQYHTEWEELGQIFAPGTQNFTSSSKPWKKLNSSIDGHAPYFAQRLAAHIFGSAVNPATKFVRFVIDEYKAKLSKQEEDELEIINDRVLRSYICAKSGFSSSILEAISSAIIFGSGALYLNNKLGDDIIFKSLPLSQIYIAENDAGQVDTLFRCFKLSAKQLVQAFGIDNVSENVRTAAAQEPESEFEVVHCTRPNLFAKKKSEKFESYYVEVENNHILEKEMSSTFPFIVFRWAKHIGEKYGHGQGKLALTAIRALSHIRRENAKSLSFANNPVVLLADDGVIIPDQWSPGGVIQGAMSSLDGQKRLETWSPAGNSQAGLALYESEKDLLGKIFFAEDITMPIDKTRRTATEVNMIKNDQIRFLVGHIARMVDELLVPMAELHLQMLVENGEFADLKTKIMDKELKPEFVGSMTSLLKMEDVRATQMFLQSVLPLSQLDPSVIDRVNIDRVVLDTQKGTGTPSYILRSDEEFQALQQQKQAAQQQQMQMQNALAASEATKNISQANKYDQGGM